MRIKSRLECGDIAEKPRGLTSQGCTRLEKQLVSCVVIIQCFIHTRECTWRPEKDVGALSCYSPLYSLETVFTEAVPSDPPVSNTPSHAKLYIQVLQIRTRVLMLTQVLSPTEPSPKPLTEVSHSLTISRQPSLLPGGHHSISPSSRDLSENNDPPPTSVPSLSFSAINYHKLNLPGWVSTFL